MDEFNYIISDNLDKLFSKLSRLGTLDSCTINNSIAVIFLWELLDSYSAYITEEDYTSILRAINCISSNICSIALPTFNQYKTYLNTRTIPNTIKLTEDSLGRFLENGRQRVLD